MNRSVPILGSILLAVSVAACGGYEHATFESAGLESQPIIQGAICTAEDYPTAVAVLVDAVIDMGSWGEQPIHNVVCTGTLIAPDVVLTAAHCLDPSAMTMGFGTVVSESYFVSFEPDLGDLAEQQSSIFPADAIEASGWVRHDQFDINAFDASVSGPGEYYDIGLIFLSETVDIQPAVVITQDEVAALDIGVDVAIVGWGQQTIQANPWLPPDPGTVGYKVCADTVINELGTHEMQIGNTGPRKCHGDSGGPTYIELDTDTDVKRRVIGITSHAYDQEDCEKGGVDTRVDAWFTWIDAEMSEACGSGTRVWCEQAGVIPPTYYDVVIEPPDPIDPVDPADPTDPETIDPDGPGPDGSNIFAAAGGGGCNQTGAGSLPAWPGLLVLIASWWQRRRA